MIKRNFSDKFMMKSEVNFMRNKCRNKLLSRICEVCGVKFTTSDINEYYCCEGCRIIASEENSNKVSNSIVGKLKIHCCKNCSKKFMSIKIREDYCNDCKK